MYSRKGYLPSAIIFYLTSKQTTKAIAQTAPPLTKYLFLRLIRSIDLFNYHLLYYYYQDYFVKFQLLYKEHYI